MGSRDSLREEDAGRIGELTPFTFPVHDGHNTIEIRNVPMAYVKDLWQKIEDMLS